MPPLRFNSPTFFVQNGGKISLKTLHPLPFQKYLSSQCVHPTFNMLHYNRVLVGTIIQPAHIHNLAKIQCSRHLLWWSLMYNRSRGPIHSVLCFNNKHLTTKFPLLPYSAHHADWMQKCWEVLQVKRQIFLVE